MIYEAKESDMDIAGYIHSVSWKESHKGFCEPDFVELHTAERQSGYLRVKIKDGSRLYILKKDRAVGIVSVKGSLIEDLYVLPSEQNKGYGTELLKFAMNKCDGTPSLWILENNIDAERLYLRNGFRRSGKLNAISKKISEIELIYDRNDL